MPDLRWYNRLSTGTTLFGDIVHHVTYIISSDPGWKIVQNRNWICSIVVRTRFPVSRNSAFDNSRYTCVTVSESSDNQV